MGPSSAMASSGISVSRMFSSMDKFSSRPGDPWRKQTKTQKKNSVSHVGEAYTRLTREETLARRERSSQ